MKRQIVTIQHDIEEIVFKFMRDGKVEKTVYIEDAQGLRDGSMKGNPMAGDGDWKPEALRKAVALNERMRLERARKQSEERATGLFSMVEKGITQGPEPEEEYAGQGKSKRA